MLQNKETINTLMRNLLIAVVACVCVRLITTLETLHMEVFSY